MAKRYRPRHYDSWGSFQCWLRRHRRRIILLCAVLVALVLLIGAAGAFL